MKIRVLYKQVLVETWNDRDLENWRQGVTDIRRETETGRYSDMDGKTEIGRQR